MRKSGRKLGRGAVSSPAPRFLRAEEEPFDDGWGTLDRDAGGESVQDGVGGAPRIATEVRSERARSIISRNDSPDIAFSASINPYRGCEHGCIYCYARPSHAYLDLSPGLDFETILVAKDNAPDVLVSSLRKRSYQVETITIGANTDPYQPIERERCITRRLLEHMLESRHPVAIITKSALILRDRDLLAELARGDLVQVAISCTTLDPRLSRVMEPRAASPARRLAVIRELSSAGIPVHAMVAPVVPAITDSEVESLVEAVAEAGAHSASYVLLRLPHEIKELFEDWLEEHFPLRKERVLAAVRQTRGGRLYDSSFGTRMRGEGTYAELLARRFRVACKRHGLDSPAPRLDTTQFCRPPAPGDQLNLF